MTETKFPIHILKIFIRTLGSELGRDTLRAVFEKAGLPPDWVEPAQLANMNDRQAGQTYAQLQSVMRTYYGRGARGILMRIGGKLWDSLLAEASFGVRAQSKLIRTLPASIRIKPSLEMLANILKTESGDVSLHTLDLDLLFVDRISPTTFEQKESAPICYVTQGLIRECLYWATGKEFDVEETSCRSMNEKECEFKIITGAKA